MYDLAIPGWMNEHDLKSIERLAARIPEHGQMVEVGSFCGRSAWAWAKSVPATVSVHCIDRWNGAKIGQDHLDRLDPPHPGVTHYVLRNFQSFTEDCPNVRSYQGESTTVLALWPAESCDLIFLDGDHWNPTFHDDLHEAWRLLKPGGIVCGHDFSVDYPDVIKETKDLCATYDRPLRFGLHDSLIWIIEHE
jgi:predicted O-methyltransferase YrrM